MYKLFLDDERFPITDDWVIVRSIEEFTQIIIDKGLPNEISFDHDLGECPNGFDCVKWMIHEMQYDLRDIKINVHSQNPVGKDNIEGLIKSWNKFLNKG